MRIDNLFQFIVPLTFLAIWALTSLFNRDAQPLPARPVRPTGPRPGLAPVPARPAERKSEPARRDEPLRWTTPTASERTAERPSRRLADDEILIIGSEPGRASSPSRPGGSGQARRGPRPKPAAATAPARRPEAPPERLLSGAMGQKLTLPLGSPLDLTTFGLHTGSLSTPEAIETARIAGAPPRPEDHSTLSSSQVRGMLRSVEKLRETIILNELLQPPLAMRRPRDGRLI